MAGKKKKKSTKPGTDVKGILLTGIVNFLVGAALVVLEKLIA